MTVQATRFARKTETVGVPMRFAINKIIGEPVRGVSHKDELPLFSPAVFADHTRSKANVLQVTALVYDVDAPWPNVAAICDAILVALPVRFCVHSTWSSEPGAVQSRVMICLDRPMTSDEHELIWPMVADVLSGAGVQVDASCKDASRMYFLPAYSPNGLYESRIAGGELLSVDLWLAGARKRTQAAAIERIQARRAVGVSDDSAGRTERARRYLERVDPAISGAHGHDQTYAAACKLVKGFGLGSEDAYKLLSTWNNRCQPPWSERDLRRKIEQARESQLEDGFFIKRSA
jgi:hypothetical protein